MSKEKQIEEMAKVLVDYTKENHIMASHVILADYAETLYNAGYRKQSEGWWEEIGQDFANCSICGTIFEVLPTMYVFKRNNIYCRHCGAYMRKEDEGK